MIRDIFKFKKANAQKLKEYGFSATDGGYSLRTFILNGLFEMRVSVKDGEVGTMLTDCESGEEYRLHLIEGSNGEFVGKVKAEYEAVLSDIRDKCFDEEIFKNAQSKQVIQYIENRYGDRLEFLWESSPSTAVWRRTDNRKWYGAIFVLQKSKLGFSGGGETEIIDLRADPTAIESLVDNVSYFRGYHMNKKSWITIMLDGSIPTQTVFDRIDESYLLALKK